MSELMVSLSSTRMASTGFFFIIPRASVPCSNGILISTYLALGVSPRAVSADEKGAERQQGPIRLPRIMPPQHPPVVRHELRFLISPEGRYHGAHARALIPA